MVLDASLRYYYAGAFLICVSLATFLVLYSGDRPIAAELPPWFSQSTSTNITSRTLQHRPVIILFWTPTFGTWRGPLSNFYSGLVHYNSCSVPCFLTRNRSLIESADAVVFHDRDANADDLPRYRTKFQRWVYWNMEAPPNSRARQMFRIRDVFNWTYTYRLDSDVPHPYFSVRPCGRHSTAPQPEGKRTLSTHNRSKLVAWVVSNCRTSSRREDYVAELRKHVTVDTFGSCGNLKCPRREECFARLAERYYFYLSLENAVCPDYVTEKLYNALHYGMVPVVMGTFSDSLVPPGSYIDALKFTSPEHLAGYLKELASTPSRYEAYFAWKKKYEIVRHAFMDHCMLCDALSAAGPEKRKGYDDIVEWWHGSGSICKQWNPSTKTGLILVE
ncbi:hypothetical protein HPB50_001679 [Hyalomma asiaticum]|uniref:Uncharacterized protein n=1 Tax=Hyalomma asiaticum TaxID=266040 RepID=A0ACB7TAN4_HYAAI|nr:hypothetical protein HPB50_001679 [Hyalomma asiaticum]